MAIVSPVRAPRLRVIVRRTVAAVALALTLLTLALLVAMFTDDARIDAARVETVATVLAVSPLRTGVEFVDATGVTVRPTRGVLYPGSLQVGQQFKIQYAADDPSTARVAGRTARTALISIALMLVGTWAIAGPVLALSSGPGRSVRRSGSVRARSVG